MEGLGDAVKAAEIIAAAIKEVSGLISPRPEKWHALSADFKINGDGTVSITDVRIVERPE